MRDKLQELWQHGSVWEYITAFKSVVVALPELAKDETIYIYIYIHVWLETMPQNIFKIIVICFNGSYDQ